MKKIVMYCIVTMMMLSACGPKQSHKQVKSEQVAVDSSKQMEDTTVNTGKSLNDIRFEGWSESDWLDNEYIRTLRGYLDDYNVGKISNTALDPYKKQIKGQFVVCDISPYLAGGVLIQIAFLDMPDRVFTSWVYSSVDEERLVVDGYEVRSIDIEEETTDLTKDDILQAVKEIPGLKLW